MENEMVLLSLQKISSEMKFTTNIYFNNI